MSGGTRLVYAQNTDVTIDYIAVHVKMTIKGSKFQYDQKFYLTSEEYEEFKKNPQFRGQIQDSVALAYNKLFEHESGFVYVLYAETMGICKIGMTRSVTTDRTNGIGIALPFETELAYSIDCFEPSTAEKKCHELFADRRIRGEWFRGKPDDFHDEITRVATEVNEAAMAKKGYILDYEY